MEPLPGVSSQETRPGTFFPRLLGVLVLDTAGVPLADAEVHFATPNAATAFWNGLGVPHQIETVRSNPQGIAEVPFPLQAGQGTGTFDVVATSPAVPSQELRLGITIAGLPPERIEVVAGTLQVASPGAQLSERFQVRVVDEAGAPVARAPFEWTSQAAGPGGSFPIPYPFIQQTGENGTATSLPFTLNAVPGSSEVFATCCSGTQEARFVVTASCAKLFVPRVQDMWWAGPAENGWGMSIMQHGEKLFIVIFAYDSAGRPEWYVLPAGSWNADNTIWTGALYVPRGSPWFAYDASRFVVGASIGQASITFTDSGHALLDITLRGVTGRKTITRQLFGPVNEALGIDIADMWWGGVAQNGWGIAVLQQQASLFIVWFTYDEAGKVTWFVVPSGLFVEPGVWQGKVYRAAGSPLLAYDTSRFSVTDIGTLRFRFTGLSTAIVEYTLDGRTGSMPVSRQGF